MARALIFGAGSVGAVYGYFLYKGGAEVTAVCRGNYAAVEANGFKISSKVFGNVSFKPNLARSVAEAKGHWDFIVVCSKVNVGVSPSTPDLLRPAVGPSTAIVLAQNGIGIEEEYSTAFPNNPILSGVVYLPTTQERPGEIFLSSTLERLELGTYPHDAPKAAKDKAEEFAKLFEAGGATCVVFDDIQAMRWSKLMVNASWNPICALTRLEDSNFIRSSDGAASMVETVMLEVIAIANAKGYHEINKETATWHIGRAKERLKSGGIEPSMLQDVRSGKPIEVEGIVGNTVRIAKDVGIDTPMLDLLYALASGLNYSIRSKTT